MDDHTTKSLTTYRFNVSDTVHIHIAEFARIHRYDNRKDYKSAWHDWSKTHSELIETETERHVRMGYQGDIADKLFKSGRYYYRIKCKDTSTTSKPRNAYKRLSNNVLDAMDRHISLHIDDAHFSPATGYNTFCLSYSDLILKELKSALKQEDTHILEPAEWVKRIKKTYKNRYYIYTRRTV
jgi:hypothetical protein